MPSELYHGRSFAKLKLAPRAINCLPLPSLLNSYNLNDPLTHARIALPIASMESSSELATQYQRCKQLDRNDVPLTLDESGHTTNGKTSSTETDIDQDVAQSLDSSPEQHTAFTPTPLEQFTLFSDLPSELRLKIWKYALSDSRVLEVLWSKSKGYYMDNDNRTPVILQVCVESRLYAMEKYTLVEVDNEEAREEDSEEEDNEEHTDKDINTDTNALTSSSCSPDSQQLPSLRFYIDPQRDTLYVSLNNSHRTAPYQEKLVWFLANLDANVASRLERLSVAFYYLVPVAAAIRDDVPGSLTLLSRFPKLKTIGMVWSDMCMSTYTDVPENQAPRRQALDIRELDNSVPFTYYKWDPIVRKATPRIADPRWRGNIPYRISIFRDGLSQEGMDKDHVEGINFLIAEIVRGDLIR